MNRSKLQILIQKKYLISPEHSALNSLPTNNMTKTQFLFDNLNENKLEKYSAYRSSHPDVFLRKGVLKISSKFTGEHHCRSAISIKLVRHGCSPVNLRHIFRTLFYKNTSGWLLQCLVQYQEVIKTESPNENTAPLIAEASN